MKQRKKKIFWRVEHNQGSGSGSQLNPDSIGPVYPDSYSEYGSGSRRAKMTHKRRKNFRNFMF
jgi:hypothetical protein